MIIKFSTHVLFGLSLAALSLSGCGEKSSAEGETFKPVLETVQVKRGEISKIINGTGKVRPETEIEVGTEVSGRILSVNVDFNSLVKQGDVLAEIDPENLENRVAQNVAQIENRLSDIRIQEASLKRAEVNAAQAARSLKRRQQLFAENAISQAQLEETERSMKLAEADIELAQARLAGAKSSLKQSEANLRVAKVDLSRTIIRAPIDGIVIERLIDPGQTVAASFSAPKLFRIAADLSKLEVDASIVEGDVSGLDAGDRATFSVDAYPGRAFTGVVKQLRLQSQTQSNIVTYSAVITAANDDRVLMPGMTANLQITTNSKKDILILPTTAERFRPTPEQIDKWESGDDNDQGPADADPKARTRLASIGVSQNRIDTVMVRINKDTQDLQDKIADPTQTWRRVSHQKAMREAIDGILKSELNSQEYQDYRQTILAAAKIRDAEIWIKDGDKMRTRTISLGLSDGSFSEVVSGIAEGDDVVSGIKAGGPRQGGRPGGRPGGGRGSR